MIILLSLLAIFISIVAIYRNPATKDFIETRSYKRDLSPHELEQYNELRKHWRKQAKQIYRKKQYGKN
jgi:hypothetical protein